MTGQCTCTCINGYTGGNCEIAPTTIKTTAAVTFTTTINTDTDSDGKKNVGVPPTMVSIVSTNVADMSDGSIGRHAFAESITTLLCTFDPKYSVRENCEESFYVEFLGTQGIVDGSTGRGSTEIEYTVFDIYSDTTVPEIDLIGCIENADEAGDVNVIFGIGVEEMRDFEGKHVWNSGWQMYAPDQSNNHGGNMLTGGGISGDGNTTGGIPHGTIVGAIIAICIVIICILFLFVCRTSDGEGGSPFPWFSKQSTKVFVCKNTSTSLALEVRNIPDITHPAVGTIEPGDRVTVLAEHPEWYKIQMQPQWDSGTVPVVWAMKVVVDDAGVAHQLLARIQEEPSYYPIDMSAMNSSNMIVFPGLGQDHFNASGHYSTVPASPAVNLSFNQSFVQPSVLSPTINRSFVEPTMQSPITIKSPFVLGGTRFVSPKIGGSASIKKAAWTVRSPSLSPPPQHPPIYTPNALHLQTKAAPPLSSTPRVQRTTPQPDYTPLPAPIPAVGMFTGMVVPASPIPKMSALSPMPKTKMTAASPLRTALSNNRKVYQSPTTTLLHGNLDRWSSPAGATTPFHGAGAGRRRSSLELVCEEETISVTTRGSSAPPTNLPGILVAENDAEYVEIDYTSSPESSPQASPKAFKF